MRKCILFILLFTGCLSSSYRESYTPVDWSSDLPVVEEKQEQNSEGQVPATIQVLLRLHNEQRELKGRSGFILDPYLNEYAQRHAEWMAKYSDLEHSDIGRLMGKYNTAGENIAWNQSDETQVVVAWMNSSGHRANILNRNFIYIGFGVAYNKNGEPFWCTCFGG